MKKVNISNFDKLVKKSEKINSKEGFIRFYPIKSTEVIGTSERKNRILIFGMYDYKNKKYVISKPFVDVNETFEEIDNMMNK